MNKVIAIIKIIALSLIAAGMTIGAIATIYKAIATNMIEGTIMPLIYLFMVYIIILIIKDIWSTYKYTNIQ